MENYVHVTLTLSSESDRFSLDRERMACPCLQAVVGINVAWPSWDFQGLS